MRCLFIAAGCLLPLLNACALERQTSSADEVHIERVSLGRCAFMISMKEGFTVDLTESNSPRLANFNGYFLGPKTKRVGETWIQFGCETPVDAAMLKSWGIKQEAGRWVQGITDEPGSQLHTRFVPLFGKNWSGGGIVQTQTAVDWSQKAKSFYFCLVHEPVALCGTAHDIQYVAYPKENALPHVVNLLQSIEFIDEPAAAASAPAASAAASAP